MPLFSRFKSKGAQSASKKVVHDTSLAPQPKPRFQSNWNSKTAVPEEIEELVHACTTEIKSRAESLDAPFLLLPFRPGVDTSSARTFISNYFKHNAQGSDSYRGAGLHQELRLTDPAVLCSIIKWCWSRVPGGVVGWTVYEAFRIGEKESDMARNAFDTFIPIGTDASTARHHIILDFFDLIAAIAARGKLNGLGGRKLSRLAGWWAFEIDDEGKGFEGGYKSWAQAADACSHLFFGYLRALSPEADASMSLIERIPRSLQALLASTEYPPERPSLMQKSSPRVLMVVDKVSPTPFALLRRAKHFEYRAQDTVLRDYQEFEDPLDALTDECRRVLTAISSTNARAALSRQGPATQGGESWSAFQELGFGDSLDSKVMGPSSPPPKLAAPSLKAPSIAAYSMNDMPTSRSRSVLSAQPYSSGLDIDRPTTPSWADFMSSGFHDDDAKPPTGLSMPAEKFLPDFSSRASTPAIPYEQDLAPGELAAITNIELDDAFWWVWMSSLASEEPAERKAVFGRCALVETSIQSGRWLVMEEQVKGAAPEAIKDAYIAPKKSFFSFSKRSRLGLKRSPSQRLQPTVETQAVQRLAPTASIKGTLGAEQQSKIKAAASALAASKNADKNTEIAGRRGRLGEDADGKTTSVLTVNVLSEATPAMKWASAYDKQAIRRQYLGDEFAGKGMSREELMRRSSSGISSDNRDSVVTPTNAALSSHPTDLEEEAPVGAGLPPSTVQQNRTSVMPSTAAMTAALAGKQDTSTVEDESTAPSPKPAVSDVSDKETAPTSNMSKRTFRRESHPALRETTDNHEAAPSPVIAPRPHQKSTPADAASVAAAAAAANLSSGSPDGKTRPIQRQASTTGGIKKLFSRKKEEVPRKAVHEEPQQPQQQAQDETPVDVTKPAGVSHRLSVMASKRAEKTVTPKTSSRALHGASPAREAVSPAAVAAGRAAMIHSPAENVNQEPVFDPVNVYRGHSIEREEERAEREWSSFDQGVEHVRIGQPTAKTNAPTPLAEPKPQRPFNNGVASRIAPAEPQEVPSRDVSPIQESQVDRTDVDHDFGARPDTRTDVQSEATMDERDEISETDRWAKIRENAARRAQARQSEDRSNQESHNSYGGRTDDGETSGEETIESRVARIKARVAELTGNLENPTVRR